MVPSGRTRLVDQAGGAWQRQHIGAPSAVVRRPRSVVPQTVPRPSSATPLHLDRTKANSCGVCAGAPAAPYVLKVTQGPYVYARLAVLNMHNWVKHT